MKVTHWVLVQGLLLGSMITTVASSDVKFFMGVREYQLHF